MPAKPKSETGRDGSTLVDNAEKLPHERDETPESGAPDRAVIRQAESDVREGQVDTDNYTRIGEASRQVPGARRDRRR